MRRKRGRQPRFIRLSGAPRREYTARPCRTHSRGRRFCGPLAFCESVPSWEETFSGLRPQFFVVSIGQIYIKCVLGQSILNIKAIEAKCPQPENPLSNPFNLTLSILGSSKDGHERVQQVEGIQL